MKKTERLVFCYDISVVAKPESAKPITVKDSIDLIRKIPKEKRTMDEQKRKEYFYISDIKQDNNIYCFLLNKSDRDISTPIFSDPLQQQRREVKKFENEGQDFSSHIMIKLSTKETNPALMLVEYCHGFGGITMIKKLLNHLLSQTKEENKNIFTQNHPDGSLNDDGTQKKREVSFSFDIIGHISDQLKADLEKGELKNIELITEQNLKEDFDEEERFEEQKTTVTIRPKKGSLGGGVCDKIMRMISNKKSKYERAKIRFNSPEGKEHVVDVMTADTSTTLYVKKNKISNFESDLLSSYDKIYDPIFLRMKEIIEEIS